MEKTTEQKKGFSTILDLPSPSKENRSYKGREVSKVRQLYLTLPDAVRKVCKE